jgi:hypothetical protein
LDRVGRTERARGFETAISTNKEQLMYIGVGTVVLILVIVLLVGMMRRGSHV